MYRKSLLIMSIALANTFFADDLAKDLLASITSRSQKNGEAKCSATKCVMPKDPSLLPEAYNAFSGINVQCGWDLFADASFTYWKATQDNMEVGLLDTADVPSTYGVNGNITKATFINQDADFKPGFKIDLGYKSNFDDWDVLGEYTWYRSTNTTSKSIESPSPATAGMIFPTFGSPATQSDIYYNSAKSNWHLRMDLADLLVGRSYKVGKKLNFHSYAGLRGAWIDQHVTTNYTNSVFTDVLLGTARNEAKSTSWGIGPKVGVDFSWDVGKSVRIYNKNSGDLLYTRYTQLVSNDRFNISSDPASAFDTLHFVQDDLDTVRAHFDFEIGAGWGTCFSCERYYLDLSAGYTFQLFMDQNMFANYMNSTTYMVAKRVLPNGNLYVQGLTATAAFHF